MKHKNCYSASVLLFSALVGSPPAAVSAQSGPESSLPVEVADTPADPAASYDKTGPAMQWWRDAKQTRDQRMGWWRDARFGCFVHWGAYSPFGGVWEGQAMPGYAEHLMRHFKLDNATYQREVVATFNPTAFDADAWVRSIKDAGMRYLVITAKHHDGFAIWDSEVTDYDIVDATPFGRDPLAELKAACDRHGLPLGFYYSHAQDWHHPQGTRADWQFDYPASRRPLWWKLPENQWHIDNVQSYFDQKALPQIVELIEKYDPALMWFDTAFWAPPQATVRALQAARAASPDLIVNSRVVTGGRGNYGDYESTADKPAEFYPVDGDWEAIPTTNESYGWHAEDHSHKPAAHFIGLLVKASARGGNLLMNLGPRGDGTIDPTDQQILADIGRWMKVNAESIHATQRTTLPVQSWGQSTRRGSQTLYLHVFDWPADGPLIVGGLRCAIRSAATLEDPAAALPVRRLDETTWAIDVPRTAPTPPVSVVKLTVADTADTDTHRLLQLGSYPETLHVFDGQLEGKTLRFGKGHADDDYLQQWTDPADAVAWPIHLREAATVHAAVELTSPAKTTGGRFELTVADQRLTAEVEPGPAGASWVMDLGELTLPAGRHVLRIKPQDIADGKELMRLHELRLTAAPTTPATPPVADPAR